MKAQIVGSPEIREREERGVLRRCDDLVLEVDLVSLAEAVELIVDHVHGAVKAAPTNVQKDHTGRLHLLLIIDGEKSQRRSVLGTDVDSAVRSWTPKKQRKNRREKSRRRNK